MSAIETNYSPDQARSIIFFEGHLDETTQTHLWHDFLFLHDTIEEMKGTIAGLEDAARMDSALIRERCRRIEEMELEIRQHERTIASLETRLLEVSQ